MRRAQRVYEALRGRPGLLYEVLVLSGRGPTVLSPWMPLANETYKRRDVAGGHVARVLPDNSADKPRWNWFVYAGHGSHGNHGEPWGEAPDEWTAMAAADATLEEFGYLLADPEPKRATPWRLRVGPREAWVRWAQGKTVPLAEAEPSGDTWAWSLHVDGTTINGEEPTLNVAMIKADEWLRDRGWMLP